MDLSKPDAVKAGIASVQSELGPVSALLWNPYSTAVGQADVATEEKWNEAFNLGVIGEAVPVIADLEWL